MAESSYTKETEALFLAAYDEYADGLYRFALVKTSSPETAQDLLQETFVRAWDYCRKGGEIHDWKPFLFRTAYNLIVDTYRKKRSVSLEALTESGFEPSDSSNERIEVQAEFARMRAAIDQLDDTYRDVVLLRFVEDLPPREIAEITGLSENVVSVRIHRGIQKLREIVQADTDH